MVNDEKIKIINTLIRNLVERERDRKNDCRELLVPSE